MVATTCAYGRLATDRPFTASSRSPSCRPARKAGEFGWTFFTNTVSMGWAKLGIPTAAARRSAPGSGGCASGGGYTIKWRSVKPKSPLCRCSTTSRGPLTRPEEVTRICANRRKQNCGKLVTVNF